MSNKGIENITTSDSNFAQTLLNFYILPYVKLNGRYLINKFPASAKVIDTYISYTLDPWSRDLNKGFTLNNCLLGFVKLTENVEPDKYVYSRYGIEFGLRSEFLLTVGCVGKSVIMFGVDMSSSVHIDNNNNSKKS